MKENETVFYVEKENGKFKVVESIYWDFVQEFGYDGCTSPIGNCNREFVEKNESTGMWDFCTWGVGGSYKKIIDSFKTEDEALDELFASMEVKMQNSDDVPQLFATREEAEADLREIVQWKGDWKALSSKK